MVHNVASKMNTVAIFHANAHFINKKQAWNAMLLQQQVDPKSEYEPTREIDLLEATWNILNK